MGSSGAHSWPLHDHRSRSMECASCWLLLDFPGQLSGLPVHIYLATTCSSYRQLIHSTPLTCLFSGVRLIHFTPSRAFAVLAATCLTRITANAVNISLSHVYAEASTPPSALAMHRHSAQHWPSASLSQVLVSCILPKAGCVHLPLQQSLCTLGACKLHCSALPGAACVTVDQGACPHWSAPPPESPSEHLHPKPDAWPFLAPGHAVGRLEVAVALSSLLTVVKPTKLPVAHARCCFLAPFLQWG